MEDEFTIPISIPSDDDGFIILQCPHCGSFFKATKHDIEDEGVLELHCPSCGLSDTDFLTDDVIELAVIKAKNRVNRLLSEQLKQMERKLNNGMVKVSIKGKIKDEFESPITSGIEAMEIVSFPCCKREAKIKPLLKMTGCYCPFCGVKNYEIE